MKFTLHPLFIAMGVLSAVFGGLPLFVIYALTALLHECGHVFCASRLGYECKKISLMPYGASAVCDTEGISPADEIKLALSGPLVNVLLFVGTAGLWWFFPQTYAYTKDVFDANAVMLCVNLLPAHPLDGGRALKCLLKKFLSRKAAGIITRCLSGILSVTFIIIFFTAYKNYSLLIFAAFLLCSVFEKDSPLLRVNFCAKKPKRGKEIKHVMLNADSTFKDALRHTDADRYVIFQFYADGLLDEICEDELYEMLQTHTVYDKIIS